MTPEASQPAASELPRTSVYSQLRQTPRIFAYMGLLTVTATSLGAKEVARWQYLDGAFDSEWGIGLTAAVSALVLAAVGLLVGRIIDQRDPRPFVMASLVLAGVSTMVTGFVLLAGPPPTWYVLVAACLDGAVFGISGVALLKTQASFVRPGAEGAAEILNVLRLGAGGVLGALLAGVSPSTSLTLLIAGSLMLATGYGLWATMRPVRPRMLRMTRAGFTTLLSYLRSQSNLRRLVVIDLALSLIIPTQLVNLVLVGLDAPEVASISIAYGMVGVLVGRLALTVNGFRGDSRALLLLLVGGLTLIQFVGAATLADGWLVRQPMMLPTLVIIGSACGTYAQGLTAAILQQDVEETYRGGLSSVLVAGRSVLIAAGVLLGTLVATTFGPQVLLLVLAGGLVLAIGATRGFAALPR